MTKEQKSQQQGMKRCFIRLKSPPKTGSLHGGKFSSLLIFAKIAATTPQSSSCKILSTIS